MLKGWDGNSYPQKGHTSASEFTSIAQLGHSFFSMAIKLSLLALKIKEEITEMESIGKEVYQEERFSKIWQLYFLRRWVIAPRLFEA